MKKLICIMLITTITFQLYSEGFVADTLVHQPNTLQCIQYLKIKDTIWSPKNFGNSQRTRIKNIEQRYYKYIVYLVVDDDIIGMAPDQLLYVEHKGIMRAKNIQSGDRILTIHNTSIKVTRTIFAEESTMVYIITAKGPSTLAVGPHGLVAQC